MAKKKRKRKKFDPETKVEIVKKHLVNKEEVSDLCDKHDLHPNLFYKWQKVLFENGAHAFQGKRDNKTLKLEKMIAKLEKKLADKNEVIAELMEDHVKLKKNLGEI